MDTRINYSLPDKRLRSHALWAKSSASSGYPLPLHVLDVAAVAGQILRRLPSAASDRAAELLSVSRKDAIAWCSTIAGMHDVGKASAGFQQKWAPGRDHAEAAGFCFSPDQIRIGDRHDVFSQAIVDRHLRQTGFPSRLRRHIAWSVGAHHGFGIAERIDGPTLDSFHTSWKEAHRELLALLHDATGSPPVPTVVREPSGWFREWLAGLVSIADWIGSDTRFFPLERAWQSYQGHWEDSNQRAAAALDVLGWPHGPALDSTRVDKEAWLAAILRGRTPRALQTVITSAVSDTDGPVLVVVEAPMGEGKTELALWISLAQAHRGSRGAYFALPTQATANGLAPRIKDFLSQFSKDGAAALQLVHAGAKRAEQSINPANIDVGRQDATSAEWFSRRRRGLIAPMGVGTVDQALIGVLEARHRFVRLFALSDRLVVLDEVHAYDAYTGGLIERLVGWLGALGSSVVLMSATLPAAQRDRLVQGWLGQTAVIPPARYPRAVVASRTAPPVSLSYAATVHRTVDVRECCDDTVAEIATTAARAGAAVLVVCNTVARAQRRFTALRECGLPVQLFHARYPAAERTVRESRILQSFGPPGTHADTSRTGIVIATQVVEQSLDLDFDLLITDLAPIDLVLQRIGRLHRHQRPHRPAGYEAPIVYIVGLGQEPTVARQQLARVYAAGPVLRSYSLLKGRPRLELPTDIDSLVQSVYAESFAWPAELSEAGASADAETKQELADQSARAANAVLPLPADLGVVGLMIPLDDDADSPGTRLGDESALVIPVYLTADQYSTAADGSLAWGIAEPVPRAIVDALLDRAVRIGDRRVLAALRRANRRLPGWQSHGALVHAISWIVDRTGESVDCPGVLTLSPELGVVFGAWRADQ